MCHANVLDWSGDLMFGGLTGFGGFRDGAVRGQCSDKTELS